MFTKTIFLLSTVGVLYCSAFTKDIAFSDGIKALKTGSDRSDRKWLAFPDHIKLHSSVESTGLDAEKILEENFWQVRGAELGIQTGHEMKLTKSLRDPGSAIIYNTYDQFIHGIRVFGGEFKLAVGKYDNILHAHGLPLNIESISPNWISLLTAVDGTQKLLSPSRALSLAISHIQEKYASSFLEIFETTPLELVWFMSGVTQGRQGTVSIAYWLNGRTSDHKSFDIFVDALSGETLLFIDKSKRASSPFVSPLPGEVRVYDQLQKNALVFDTTATPAPAYPTTDAEMNMLIDNTYYMKYFIQSISGGEFVTWRGFESELQITTNLEISNAYFDGYSGIYFGTGFITDDVICHEWGHGYDI